MSAIKELIRTEADGTLSFGDYELGEKTKRSDFEYQGDLYKVKTYCDITKLERNGLLVYESVPGTAVHSFEAAEQGVSFEVDGPSDAQVTLGLEEDAEYEVTVGGASIGTMKTKMGGKLVLGIETGAADGVPVKVVKR
jgi:hypothetical protein